MPTKKRDRRAYTRAYYLAHRNLKRPLELVCKHCGTIAFGDSRKRYCSKSCRNKAFNARKVRPVREPSWLQCLHCGEDFLRDKTRRRYCTPICRWRAQNRRRSLSERHPASDTRTCRICGASLAGRRLNAVVCFSPECRRENQIQGMRARQSRNADKRLARTRGKTCPFCGTPILRDSTRCLRCRADRRPAQELVCWQCGRRVFRREDSKRATCEDCYGLQARAATVLGLTRQRIESLVRRERERSADSVLPRDALFAVLARRGVQPDQLMKATAIHESAAADA